MRLELPTKEQIQEIRDLEILTDWEREIEASVAKMDVDLSYITDDEEWHLRARRALAAHKIALKNVKTRIYRLTKGDLDTNQAQAQLAKAIKKEASVKGREVNNKRNEIIAKTREAKAQNATIALIERTSYLAEFKRTARLMLEPELFIALCEETNKAHLARLKLEFSPQAPTEPSAEGL